jgi:hypothetical protein
MTITLVDKIEQDELILDFQRKFYKRFGIKPKVEIEEQLAVREVTEDLEILEEIINKFIPFELIDEYKSIVNYTRKKEMIQLRMIFVMIARDSGYTFLTIAKHCGKDHSTIINSLNKGYDLLETDSEFQKLYIKVSYSVNPNLYPHARINKPTYKTQNNSKSAGFDPEYSGKYQVFRPSSNYYNRDNVMSTKRVNKHRQQVVA